MNFKELSLPGCFLVTPDFITDDRGFFGRFFCESEFLEKTGREFTIKQMNNSLSKEAGTWRGLHYQTAPWGEAKYLRCIAGSIADYAVDLREGSPTFLKALRLDLSAESRTAIYIPEGFAHGFLSLSSNSEVLYATSSTYSREHERAIRWNEPSIRLDLPFEPRAISFKDSSAPDYSPATHASGYSYEKAR